MLTKKLKNEIIHQLKVMYNKGYARGFDDGSKSRLNANVGDSSQLEELLTLRKNAWKIKDYDRLRAQYAKAIKEKRV